MKKMIVVALLVLMGVYWLVDHSAPLPFNHDSLGLYYHNVHRALGIVFFVIAGVVAWKWKKK